MGKVCEPFDEVCSFGYNEHSNWTGVGNVSTQNGFEENPDMVGIDNWTLVFTTCYGIICLLGTVGNGLVIFVVSRYAKMKTVTNIYILNLAVADLCFLVGLPFLITTAITREWLFGFLMCKIFYILTSINWFTSVFMLTVISADRYLAVCHPVQSVQYRTPLIATIVCICVWVISFLVMLPIVLYATTLKHNHVSCTIQWPKGQAIEPDEAFIWYVFLLGFAIPVLLIIICFALVLLRLSTVSPRRQSKKKKGSHRKITKMVLAIIAVYIICWLPYWVFQITLIFLDVAIPPWSVLVFQIITVLSYANSMLNPLLYAFLSENFRKSFIKTFHCASANEVNGALNNEHSTYNRTNVSRVVEGKGMTPVENIEIQTCTTKTRSTTTEAVTTQIDVVGGTVSLATNHSESNCKDFPVPEDV